jgi:hypothetical protein
MPRIEDSCGKGFAALKLEGVANGGEIRPVNPFLADRFSALQLAQLGAGSLESGSILPQYVILIMCSL